MAIWIVKVDRRGRNEAKHRGNCGTLLEEVAELDAPPLEPGHQVWQVLQPNCERKVLGKDAFTRTFPEAEHGLPGTADPEKCEAAGTEAMRVSARCVHHLPPHSDLKAQDRPVKLE